MAYATHLSVGACYCRHSRFGASSLVMRLVLRCRATLLDCCSVGCSFTLSWEARGSNDGCLISRVLHVHAVTACSGDSRKSNRTNKQKTPLRTRIRSLKHFPNASRSDGLLNCPLSRKEKILPVARATPTRSQPFSRAKRSPNRRANSLKQLQRCGKARNWS